MDDREAKELRPNLKSKLAEIARASAVADSEKEAGSGREYTNYSNKRSHDDVNRSVDDRRRPYDDRRPSYNDRDRPYEYRNRSNDDGNRRSRDNDRIDDVNYSRDQSYQMPRSSVAHPPSRPMVVVPPQVQTTGFYPIAQGQYACMLMCYITITW